MSDAGNTVARRYGLVHRLCEGVRSVYTAIGSDPPTYSGDQSWELPMPGTFVIARDGTVGLAFVDPDFTRRPRPAAILSALSALSALRELAANR